MRFPGRDRDAGSVRCNSPGPRAVARPRCRRRHKPGPPISALSGAWVRERGAAGCAPPMPVPAEGDFDVLRPPDYGVIVVEHRDRLARFGSEYIEAALTAMGRRLVVGPEELEDDPGARHDRCTDQHVHASVWPSVGPEPGGEGADGGERGMTVHQAFRYELDPTARQRRILARRVQRVASVPTPAERRRSPRPWAASRTATRSPSTSSA